MKFLISVICLIWASTLGEITQTEPKLNKAEYPKKSVENLESFKYFNDLVRAKNLNVSLIISYHNNKEISNLECSIGFTFPTKDTTSKQKRLTKEEGTKFVELATQDKLPVKVLLAKENEKRGWSNNPELLPVSKLRDFISDIINGSNGFKWNETNFIQHHTFVVPGEDGKKEITEVTFGDLDIQVIQSENFTKSEIKIAQKLLANAYFIYTPNDFEQALGAMFKLALKDYKWQIVSGASLYNYLKAKKLIILELLEKKYLVYAI